MWERMQVEAEEKRKGYCCLVFSERPVTREELADLSSYCQLDQDEAGERCLAVSLSSRSLPALPHRSLRTPPFSSSSPALSCPRRLRCE